VTNFDPTLRAHAAAIESEHQQVMAQLDQLDLALEKIVCYSDVFADLASANQAISGSKWLAEWLPRHYQHEETTVLAAIAQMSPDLASFAREMKQQHRQMRLRLENLRELLNHLPQAQDLEVAVDAVRKAGAEFTRGMRLHMSSEDKKLGTLEN